MQADALAHQAWREDHRLEDLSDAIDHRDRDKAVEIAELKRGRQQREDQAGGEADVGNEHQEAGQDADRQRDLEARDAKRGRVVDREDQHQQQLAAQKFRKHMIDLSSRRADARVQAARNQRF